MTPEHPQSDSQGTPEVPRPDQDEDLPVPFGDTGHGLWAKLALTVFPFALVLVFLLLEAWLRGRP